MAAPAEPMKPLPNAPSVLAVLKPPASAARLLPALSRLEPPDRPLVAALAALPYTEPVTLAPTCNTHFLSVIWYSRSSTAALSVWPSFLKAPEPLSKILTNTSCAVDSTAARMPFISLRLALATAAALAVAAAAVARAISSSRWAWLKPALALMAAICFFSSSSMRYCSNAMSRSRWLWPNSDCSRPIWALFSAMDCT